MRQTWFIFSAVVLALVPGRALSFPENVRHGYPSCAACHVSPAGGGALTNYGRGASEAFMSTWSYEGEGQPLHGVGRGLANWVAVGGDQRAVEVATRTPDGKAYAYVPMQADAELALSSPWAPNLTFDVAGGAYGPERAVEYRRFYLKAMVSPNVGVRAGRFTPAYGIAVPDHTTVTRSGLGLGEGDESYNVEGFWLAPRGELIVTGIFGQAATAELDHTQLGTLRTNQMVGSAARAAVYAPGGSSVGVSAMGLRNFEGARRLVYGAFTQTAVSERAFVLLEADSLRDKGMPNHGLAFARIGYELVAGLVASVQGEGYDKQGGWRVGLQWQPRPHFELQLEYRRATQDGFDGLPREAATALLHHWL